VWTDLSSGTSGTNSARPKIRTHQGVVGEEELNNARNSSLAREPVRPWIRKVPVRCTNFEK